jgi:hypothetical protein
MSPTVPMIYISAHFARLTQSLLPSSTGPGHCKSSLFFSNAVNTIRAELILTRHAHRTNNDNTVCTEPLIRNIQQQLFLPNRNHVPCETHHEAQTRVHLHSRQARLAVFAPSSPGQRESLQSHQFFLTDFSGSSYTRRHTKHNTTAEECSSRSTPTGHRLSTGTQSSNNSMVDRSSPFTRRQSMGRQPTHRLPSYRLLSLRPPSRRQSTVSRCTVS